MLKLTPRTGKSGARVAAGAHAMPNNGHRGRSSAACLVVGYPSGQRGQTVNLLAKAFGGSNPSLSNEGGQSPPSLLMADGEEHMD